MLALFKELKNIVKTRSYHIDKPFFRLHYQITFSLLTAFCLIVSANVIFGDVIDCLHRNSMSDDFHDNACYAVGTYTKFKFNDTIAPRPRFALAAGPLARVDPDKRFIYSGIMLGSAYHSESASSTKIKYIWHTYYQYMPIILFLQAILFYFPHYLWKIWENGSISSISKCLLEHRFTPADYIETNYDIIYYLQNTFKLNKSLIYKYHFCHVLLLLNLVIQIIALDEIFNKQFISYGYLTFKYFFIDSDIYGMRVAHQNGAPDRDLNSPMDFVFPKMTVCQIDSVSPAGLDQNKKELLCVLSLNILHDKFYLLLWFWFAVLTVLTLIQIVCDLLYITLPLVRKYLFIRHYGSILWEPDTKRSVSLSELFILDLVGSNTDKLAFMALLRKLTKEDWTASPSENHSVV